MRNLDLAHDYLKRAGVRLSALDVLYRGESWADVVCESQEVVELALKALLRTSGVDVPRVHDVAPILIAERARLPQGLAPHLDELAASWSSSSGTCPSPPDGGRPTSRGAGMH